MWSLYYKKITKVNFEKMYLSKGTCLERTTPNQLKVDAATWDKENLPNYKRVTNS